MKKLFIFILCVIIFFDSYSQTIQSKDSVIDINKTDSKFHQSLGFGVSNIEQRLIGPASNLTTNVNIINLAINTNYNISKVLNIEGTIAALIGSSFNYYSNDKYSLSNFQNGNTNMNSPRPIFSTFEIISSSININVALLRNKPSFLFFIPSYLFIGPKYDALIGVGGGLKLNNYLGYQYGFKYKFGLKHLNIYPVVTISETPNLYVSGSPLISNISNRYTSFSLYFESKASMRKFKKYIAPSKLRFSDIPLFKWRE